MLSSMISRPLSGLYDYMIIGFWAIGPPLNGYPVVTQWLPSGASSAPLD